MKSRILLTLIVLAAFCSAEPSPPPPESSAAPPDAKASMINLDFPGGTVSQLVTALSHSNNPPVNIIGEKGELATPLPAFSIRNADPRALFNSLATLLATQGVNLLPSGTNTYTLIHGSPDGGFTKSFQIASCLRLQSVDEIVDAIKVAWQMNPAHKPEAIQLKYHPPTTLLLVFGPPEAIDVATRVVSSLKGFEPLPTEATEQRRNTSPPPVPAASPPTRPHPPEREKQ